MPTSEGTKSSGARTSSSRAVHADLRRRIVSLELAPGAPLSVNELAASLGVSRTPVRESLIRLADEGLVQVFPKIGTFVSRIDPQRVADAQFLREAVELASLASLVELADAPDPRLVAELQENLSAQRDAVDDIDEFIALDDRFHQGLLRLAGHDGTWSAVAAAKVHLDRARRLGLQATPSQEFVRQHEVVLRAVAAGDLEGAIAHLRAHLRAVFTDIEQIRLRSPELFSTQPLSVPARRNIPVWS